MKQAVVEDELEAIIDILGKEAHPNLVQGFCPPPARAGENVDFAMQIVEHLVSTFVVGGEVFVCITNSLHTIATFI